MRITIIQFFITLFFTSFASANGPNLTIREQAQGTAEIDEEYLRTLEDAPQLEEESKNKQLQKSEEIFEKNPRNPAFSESFERVEQKKRQNLEKMETEEEKIK